MTPFVPSNDYSLSLQFYQELGFDVIAEMEKMTLCGTSNVQFWLQDYDVRVGGQLYVMPVRGGYGFLISTHQEDQSVGELRQQGFILPAP